MKTMPNLGMGTYRLTGELGYNTVKRGLELGYRHIDTAQFYKNEGDVGAAIADSSVARSDIFLTTKIWFDKLGEDFFMPSVEESLRKLKVSSVDLLLVHWPSPDGLPMEEYLLRLLKAQELGLTENIGVSNFTNAQIDQAIAILGKGKLLTNQVEVQPYLQNRAVINHCKENNILVTGYMPLAVGKVMNDPLLSDIAKSRNASIAQIVIAWELQQGLATIPSSSNPDNLANNLKAKDIILSEQEMQEISTLDCGDRIADSDFSPDWD